MASTADFRNGMVIEIDGDPWAITYFQHVKPGKGGAFVRTKLKNVLSGSVVDKTYRAGEKVDAVRLERSLASYHRPASPEAEAYRGARTVNTGVTSMPSTISA